MNPSTTAGNAELSPVTAPADGEAAPVASLASRIPEGGVRDPDTILDLFLGWVDDVGFELYPAQEEALLELMAGHHVVLNTPTGSGKSLVALGLQFKALCEGRVCFYTSPIKALASEKFFALCKDLGPDNVGMLTGDASINPRAPILCCTAEVLSNMALRQGDRLNAPYVVMDEFHYYADRARGVAWQIPLITLPYTRFLLMSATLGNTAPIEERLAADSGVEVACVRSDERPVPLDYEYRKTPLHETLQELHADAKLPAYVVNFTQRECAELAQSLTSMKLADREERKAITAAIGDFRFDTPYGKDVRRFLGFGIGIHHAGLLPKYRLLVEQLSQNGHLKVICGTDTLGVGVNIPIRTVVFTKLSKYDGHSTKLLSVRDFRQISGRAGRKGFDVAGSVVCQAPEHVIENLRQAQKASSSGKKKPAHKKKPREGFVSWTQESFQKLAEKPPEMLKPQFRVSHGMVLNLLQHDAAVDNPEHRNFHSLRRLIAKCHEEERAKPALLSEAAQLVRSLYRAGLIKMVRDQKTAYYWVEINQELQTDFSLFQALSLYLVETLDALEPDSPEFGLDVLTLVEAVLENPDLILRKQVDKLKSDLIARLKAEGVPYEERMEKLDQVTHPKPNAEFLYATFDAFREVHPWVGHHGIRPKSIGREMYENYLSFTDYVRNYSLQRSEGVLLRYLSQLYKTLIQSVPERRKNEQIYDVESYLRTMLERTDTSLIEEWQSLLHPELRIADREEAQATREQLLAYELLHDPKAFAARVRNEMHQVVRDLSKGHYQEAAQGLRIDPEEPQTAWTSERLEAALAPFLEEYGELVFTPQARQAHRTRIEETAPRQWKITQVLLDPQGDDLWHLAGDVDLRAGQSLEGPLVRLRHIGP